jgi:hypothetical protein
MQGFYGLLIVLLSCSGFGAGLPLSAAEPPVRVVNVRRAFHNGEHNAFTDLCRFRGRYYLTFRSCPDGHMVFPSASIIILASDDAVAWDKVAQFSVPRRDTRDPHFLVFQEKLFVYTGTWYCGEGKPAVLEYNKHLGYAAWSGDGRLWHGPRMLEGTYGHYIWRAAAFGGKAYLCGRRKREFVETPRSDRDSVESAMLESDDGLVWRKRALFQETLGDETAFLFEPDGSALAVSRRGSREAQILRAAAPYERWERNELDRYIGGPLLAKWGARYVVGGRRITDGGAKTSLCWLDGDELREFAQLPSAGDNSYPGWIELSPTRALVSWYSSHENGAAGQRITAIYLAELTTDER